MFWKKNYFQNSFFTTKCWSENLIRLKEVEIFDENKTKKSCCPEAKLHCPTGWSVNRFDYQ